jgi:CheY-like chemotaxis protein
MLESSSEALSSEHVTLTINESNNSTETVAQDIRKRASETANGSSGKDGRSSSFSSEKSKRPHPDRTKSEGFFGSKPPPSPTPRPTASPTQQPQQSPQPKVDLELPSVLAVDDNQINLQLMVTFVRKTRHPYESATDGALALEAYKKSATHPSTGRISSDAPKRFKYILMDINMPNMDGTTATKEIRKFEKENELKPPVKIFALTGLGDLEQPWTKEAGFDKVLSKPIKFKELKELLV